MLEKTQKFCNWFLEQGVPGFDLAVFQHGKCILRHTNGYNNLEHKTTMQGNERYNIYSCSKLITCTAALLLWEKGLFSLEDKLSDYMPEFADMTVKTAQGIQKARKPILIKHLFEMTAGFSYDCDSPQLRKCKAETNGRCPTREVMKYLAKEPLLFEPGDKWEYSLCHDVLAALVEVISGEKFEDYVKKNIFDVLGMKHSTFLLPDEDLDTIASQYSFQNGKAVNIGKWNCYKFGSEYASGGAGCISTVDDYMMFLEGLRTHKILKADTLKLFTTARLSEQQKRTYCANNTHGYGLGVRCPEGDKVGTDFGWGGAACAYAAVDLENEISLFFGCHLMCSPVQGARSALYRFVRAELLENGNLDNVQKELQQYANYNLTY